jgi:drug/metabolite transporter (DMT)-like permease
MKWYNGRVVPILLAALSAVVWGTGDFSGGKATRHARALTVTVVSQLAALPVLAVCVALIGGRGPTPTALAWGTVAGAAGFAGILLLYRGLSLGAMSVFAPVSAMTTALVPLVVGLAVDRTPSMPALVGACVAVVAIGLVSRAPGGGGGSPGLIGLALICGVCFGVFFVILAKASGQAGLWPLVGVRVGSLGAGLLVVARARVSLVLPRPARGWAVLAGSADILANALYLVAATTGPLAIVAPIGALYPVSTVVLAILVDRERVAPAQLAGLGLAATALVLAAT